MRTRRMGSAMAITVFLAGVGMVLAGVLAELDRMPPGMKSVLQVQRQAARGESHVDRVLHRRIIHGRHSCWLPMAAALMA